MSSWAEPAISISFSVVYPIHPSKDALYGFFYGSALTKYLLNIFCSIKFEFKLDFIFFCFDRIGVRFKFCFIFIFYPRFSSLSLLIYIVRKKREFNEILSKVVKFKHQSIVYILYYSVICQCLHHLKY